MKAEKKEARKQHRAEKVASNRGEVSAKLSFLRISTRKVRFIADMVRGMNVGKAITALNVSPRKAAKPVAKLIRSAVAAAEERQDMDLDILVVKTIMVDEGPTLRRFIPRAMGRATRINKRTSHVKVILAEA